MPNYLVISPPMGEKTVKQWIHMLQAPNADAAIQNVALLIATHGGERMQPDQVLPAEREEYAKSVLDRVGQLLAWTDEFQWGRFYAVELPGFLPHQIGSVIVRRERYGEALSIDPTPVYNPISPLDQP